MPRQIKTTINKIAVAHERLALSEQTLETAANSWLDSIRKQVKERPSLTKLYRIISELTTLLETLMPLPKTLSINHLIGKTLSTLFTIEQTIPHSAAIMLHLLNRDITEKAQKEKKRLFVVNPHYMSTRVAYFEGIEKVYEADLHLSPDSEDSIDTRVESICSWLSSRSIELASLDGIAARCGFLQPVPSGTYRIVPEMLADLEQPRIDHPSNMSLAITSKLIELSGKGETILHATSDPVVSDEIDTVERLTGYIKQKRDGSGAHYLNHKAVVRVLASMVGRSPDSLTAITAHLGRGMSIVIHRGNRVSAVIDTFSGLPTTNRCGPLDLPRLLDAIKNDVITFKELESVVYSRGGLLSLAGTDDFRALEAFRHKGATATQQKKIGLLFDFFARHITSAILKLTADGLPVDMVALTGGLARSEELVKRIEKTIAWRYPLVLIPGSLEQESLAGGLLRGFYEPESIKDYVRERDALKEKRHDEDHLLDTVIFDRQVIYRKKDAPILSLDELIDATRITVKEHFMPTITIVGADNEEAILAAKRANEEGNYRIAKFILLGDFAEINKIAYDFDLVIDNDNYTIYDTENPVEEALRLLDTGQTHLLMKGSLHTDVLLRGVFHYIKNSGRLKPGELISHVFVMDIPVRNKLLLITDAAVNPYPDEEKKIKIIENALKVAHHLNIRKTKVAVTSAIENVNVSIESSIEAERIAERFASRIDCIVEGPLSFDVAMDQKIALEKNYAGAIRGNADILLMPNIDAGNILYKSLTTQSGASAAGVILCGDMPLILTSRGDTAHSKLASLSLAVKLFFDLQSGKQ